MCAYLNLFHFNSILLIFFSPFHFFFWSHVMGSSCLINTIFPYNCLRHEAVYASWFYVINNFYQSLLKLRIYFAFSWFCSVLLKACLVLPQYVDVLRVWGCPYPVLGVSQISFLTSTMETCRHAGLKIVTAAIVL